MSVHGGKTTNTDAYVSRNDEEEAPFLADMKLTRNSIRSSNRASIDQKAPDIAADENKVRKKTVKTRNQINLDNLPSDERKKPVTRSQTTQKDLSSDDDDHYKDDDDNDEESKQKHRISHSSKTSSTDVKKAGMGNQTNKKNLFSDDDDDLIGKRKNSPSSKTSNRDHKKAEKRNQTDKKDLSSDDTSWFSSVIKNIFLIVTLAVAVFLAAQYSQYGASRSRNNSNVLQQFQNHFNALKSSYASQSEDLWKRSRRSLELHLNKSEANTQPAIILLTAARDGKNILQCLSNQLARVYSASRNNSYMVISGANKTFHNSESAKLAIDNILTAGFQDTSSAAVLHQIESLHPGALLILYKYCDHENAAFKNVALVLTVLLEDSELEPQLSLTEIEEKVRDFINEKMVSSKNAESHSEMDVDKLSGVWSRISHTVLPVYPEDNFADCGGTEQGL
ncbi:torsin-1A-interacting protein 1 isoform X10 [Xenopus tropicalis]|uniref:Torsin-1A-interacting protein 1 isoform X10 n=1 Tax=Xenopus tropicalis TaxID=8364 RepID=A0A8J0SD78_XENTR|nr:torsin-1A-interacting protein 1 isoform X10 [Xenopus tropicalis]|eukprot:XP_012817876.1 PREDICTED: torsin-1A-interacting protein 1 isoform X8 [Xenopus tropicalis]